MESGFRINSQPSDWEIQYIKDELKAFNDSKAGDDDHRLLNLVLYNDVGEIVAGLVGATYWGWLYVDRFWVRADQRRKGIGRHLLGVAEREAKNRGCKHAHLDTMDFQALGFYLKQGYRIGCELVDLPETHSKYLLMKDL